MPVDSFFDKAQKTTIYYKFGEISRRIPRLTKAPADIVSFAGEQYVQPTPFGIDAISPAIGMDGDTSDQWIAGRDDMGWTTRIEVMEPNEWGDWDQDNLVSHHQFGMV